MDDAAPVRASEPLADAEATQSPARLFALKDCDMFVVGDAFGDLLGGADGLFNDDTRILSRFRLSLAGRPPALLSAGVSQDNVFFTTNATNLPLPLTGGMQTPRGVLHLERKRFLYQQRLYERVRLSNFGDDRAEIPVRIELEADFRDIFEIRGEVRRARGTTRTPEVGENHVTYRYVGLDDVERETRVHFSPLPNTLGPHAADFFLAVDPGGCAEVYIEVGVTSEAATPSRQRFRAAAARARSLMHSRRANGARIRTSGRLFDEWLAKSRADLALLTTALPTGPYPYAGIPWFSTQFGRDAIITAWQILWLDPDLARGVLGFLAAHQAQETSAFQDAQPGKILHEMRRGEMARLGEVPFGKYYGGVDSTPLFVALAGAYAERTNDFDFVEKIWPALKAAVSWIETFGDSNGDGLVDYQRAAGTGLANQGWKDSVDSVFHADGAFPKGPIALVEVQGYVFMAYNRMAELSARRGAASEAARYRDRAEALRLTVEDRFWMEEQGTYGIALDGEGRLCRISTSNPGHLLFSGLPAEDRGRRVAETLMGPKLLSGWGVRTLASGTARFNPMSYHDGSVWPHDSALCAAGMARYGRRDAAREILAQIFETAVRFDMRLPELYCGFPRASGEGPVGYPVACLPQAWAAGSVFMLLQAALGLSIDAAKGEVRVETPELPIGIDHLQIRGLQVGSGAIDLSFDNREGRATAVVDGRTEPGLRLTTFS